MIKNNSLLNVPKPNHGIIVDNRISVNVSDTGHSLCTMSGLLSFSYFPITGVTSVVLSGHHLLHYLFKRGR